MRHSLSLLASTWTLMLSVSSAQSSNILGSIKPVPTTDCKTDSGKTVTWTAAQAGRTGGSGDTALNGGFLDQAGAKWTFSTDTKGVTFSDPKPIGRGEDPPKVNSDAAKLDKSSQSWTLTIPTGPDFDQLDKNLDYYWSIRYEGAKKPYNLKLTGLFPCGKSDGLKSTELKLDSSKIDPAVSSQCASNSVPTDRASWSRYNVPKLLEQVFERSPADKVENVGTKLKLIDIGSALNKASGGAQDICKIDSNCNLASCNKIHPGGPADNNTVPIFLANRAYVNLANWMSAWYRGMDKSAIAAGFKVDDFAKTFFSNDIPKDLAVSRIAGATAPFLGILSGALGAFGPLAAAAGSASGALGGLSGVAGSIGGVFNAKQGAASDPTFTVASGIGAYFEHLYVTTQSALSDSFSKLIGETTAVVYVQSSFGPSTMADGFWLDKTFDATTKSTELQQSIFKKFGDIFFWKAINYAWKASNVFIIYVPYGKIMGTDSKAFDLGPSNCKKTCGDDLKCYCDSDAKGGMARLYRATDSDRSLIKGDQKPNGLDSKDQLGNWKFNTQDIIQGSLNSWREGNFNYSIEDAVNIKNPGEGLIRELSAGIKATRPGIWDIPVCKVFDLFSFPKDDGNLLSACGCLLSSAGGGKDPNVKFADHVSGAIKDAASPKAQDNALRPPGPPVVPKCNVATDFQK